jgi:hypothetical protein
MQQGSSSTIVPPLVALVEAVVGPIAVDVVVPVILELITAYVPATAITATNTIATMYF